MATTTIANTTGWPSPSKARDELEKSFQSHSLAYRVCSYFLINQDEELNSTDVQKKFSAPNADALLHRAVEQKYLCRTKGGRGEPAVFKAGPKLLELAGAPASVAEAKLSARVNGPTNPSAVALGDVPATYEDYLRDCDRAGQRFPMTRAQFIQASNHSIAFDAALANPSQRKRAGGNRPALPPVDLDSIVVRTDVAAPPKPGTRPKGSRWDALFDKLTAPGMSLSVDLLYLRALEKAARVRVKTRVERFLVMRTPEGKTGVWRLELADKRGVGHKPAQQGEQS